VREGVALLLILGAIVGMGLMASKAAQDQKEKDEEGK